MLLLTEAAIGLLYSAPRLILCERSLLDSFRKSVSTQATVIPYKGSIIGETSPEGAKLELADFGLPVALEMIVAPEGCPTARAVLDLAESSGFPSKISLLEVAPRKFLQLRPDERALSDAYQRVLEGTVSALHAHVRERELEVAALRRRVETQTLTNNHLSDFLSVLGYASQELMLERIPDLGQSFAPAPLQQHLPALLSDIAGVSLYAAPAAGPRKINVGIGVHGDEVFRREVELPAAGGWHDLFFPEAFLNANHDAVLSIEAVEGEPAFAMAEGVSDARLTLPGTVRRSLALRIWRHADARVHPLRRDAVAYIPRPKAVAGNVLAAGRLLDAAKAPQIEAIVSLRDDCFVQTHPVEGEIANFVVRDVVLGATEAVEATVCLAHPKASPVRFMLFLAPQQHEEQALYDMLRSVAGGAAVDDVAMAETTLSQPGFQTLELSTRNLDRQRSYCLMLAAQSASGRPKFAWAQWRRVALRLRTPPQRQTYRFSYFTTLTNQIQYADGPVRENEINSRIGFPILATTDGDRFLQTHPVEGMVVAARLDSFIPAGMQRLWIDISNDHEGGSPTEFGILLTRSLIEGEFSDNYAANGYGDLADDMLHALPDGRFLKKTVLKAREKATIDVFLTEPLSQGGHLYVYVKTRNGTAQYGWCRWHRLAMTILAGEGPIEG